MRILITGNMGYVGPVLVRHLRRTLPAAELVGFDNGYFAHCLTDVALLPETALDEQHFGDVRELPERLLEGVDAVVHLAAISNDPMGNRFEQVTEDINYRASARLCELARRRGVKNLVFASSCSVYGAGSDNPRTERDKINPLTAYARSKIATEQALAQSCDGIVTTCLRFATACGMSERLRLDLVLNDFVACALALGEISVLSDGTPWRPLIDVSDMARAIEWAVRRPAERGGGYLIANAGSNQWNYQVNDLAAAVAAEIPGTTITINEKAAPDRRSYRVDFGLFTDLAPDHRPAMTLAKSIDRVRRGLSAMGFADRDFRNSDQVRLKVLERHIAGGRLSLDLRWLARGAAANGVGP